jgi:MarR family transcriptional regulator, 2-MHQ and catechol-resistance regulon repressor
MLNYRQMATSKARQAQALAAYVKLLRASDSVQAEAMRSLAQEDITPSQFAVLEALYHVGPMCLSVLAEKILKTSGNLTMVVGNLEKRGLVTRQQSTDDRRFVRAAITEKGKRLIARIFPAHAARITELMNRLTPREQEILGELCRKLGRNSAAASEP